MSFIALIINPISGGARPEDAAARAARALVIARRRGDAAEAFVTTRRGHARELAAVAVARGARLVMAWGGDGTINEVASALAFGEVPLGIVPSGSGNGLARELGIDQRPERAIAGALGARPRPIDAGELGGRLFVNIAGIGFDADVAARFDRTGNRRRGWLAYAAISGRALLTYAPTEYTIVTPNQRVRVRAVLVSIANSAQFGNGARIAPGARVDDGLLDLVVVAERSRVRTICHLPRLFTGSVDRMPGCSIARIREATIACDRPMVFHVDGEPVVGGTELTARVHAGALRVCVA